jgi:hypothetical protein
MTLNLRRRKTPRWTEPSEAYFVTDPIVRLTTRRGLIKWRGIAIRRQIWYTSAVQHLFLGRDAD